MARNHGSGPATLAPGTFSSYHNPFIHAVTTSTRIVATYRLSPRAMAGSTINANDNQAGESYWKSGDTEAIWRARTRHSEKKLYRGCTNRP